MGKQKRTGAEMRRMLEEYRNSGMKRGEFCQRHEIPLTTFDYWVGAERRRQNPLLVEVEIERNSTTCEPKRESNEGFTLRLANGRRIESGWRFGDADLARLIRVVETA